MNWTPEEQLHIELLSRRFLGLFTAYSWAPRSQLMREQVAQTLAEEVIKYVREQEQSLRHAALKRTMDSLAGQVAGAVRDARRTPQGFTEEGWRRLQERREADDAS